MDSKKALTLVLRERNALLTGVMSTLISLMDNNQVRITRSELAYECGIHPSKLERYISKLLSIGVLNGQVEQGRSMGTLFSIPKEDTISNTLVRDLPGNTSSAQNMALWLWKKLIERHGKGILTIYDAKVKKWEKDCDGIIRLDRRNSSEVKVLFEWALQDEFWSKVIISPGSFRKNYDKMLTKMNAYKPTARMSSNLLAQ